MEECWIKITFNSVCQKNYYKTLYLNPLENSSSKYEGYLNLNIMLDLFWKIYGGATIGVN